MAFLPMNAKEMRDRGWSEVDFVYVCGKAECDIIGEICNFADFNTGGRL